MLNFSITDFNSQPTFSITKFVLSLKLGSHTIPIIVVTCLRSGLMLSLICLFLSTAAAENYWPFEIGNTWMLENTDGTETFTYTIAGPEILNGKELRLQMVTRPTGTDSIASTQGDTYFLTRDNEGLKLNRAALDAQKYGILEATYDPPTAFFPTVLPPIGHTSVAVTKTQLKGVGRVTLTSKIVIVTTEDVETPAGVFEDCVKLEINGTVATFFVTKRSTVYHWLAPEVGPVQFQNAQGIVFKLQSYTLGGSPHAPSPEVPADITVPEEGTQLTTPAPVPPMPTPKTTEPTPATPSIEPTPEPKVTEPTPATPSIEPTPEDEAKNTQTRSSAGVITIIFILVGVSGLIGYLVYRFLGEEEETLWQDDDSGYQDIFESTDSSSTSPLDQ